MKIWAVRVLMLGVMLAAVTAGAQETPSGKVAIETKSIAVGIGVSWGDGKLTYQGKDHSFTVNGLSVVDVGVSKVSTTGNVYHLKKLSDFAGNYAAAEAGAALGAGKSAVAMRNQNGVVMELTSTATGIQFTLAQRGRDQVEVDVEPSDCGAQIASITLTPESACCVDPASWYICGHHMHFGAFFYGTVDMPDAGADGPPAHRRRYGQEDYRRVYADLIAYAEACDQLGYDSMWTAEHHFHDHGFEVVPNVVLLNAVLAQHTRRIRLGALIHVLTAWHPIHFAEDYALADVLAGGRLLCGLGRGTEERESNVFGVNVGYNNNADDLHNREVFEEQVAIFKAATASERFAHRGRHYTIPPEGLTFRGEPVTEFPLVPRPLDTPVRIYQPISTEDTLRYAARQRHVGVLANHPWERLVEWWRQYAALVEKAHGVRLRPGEDRILQVQLHMADSAEAAVRTARRGHDELTKLLWPNIIRRTPALANRKPFALEERMAGKSWIVGTPEQARDTLLAMQEELGFEALLIFPHLPGMRRADTLEQLGRFWNEVRPALTARVPTKMVAGA